MTMRFEETGIAGAMVIEPAPHADSRGRFMRSWCVREFADSGIEFVPVQANRGFSTKRGTLRGMHFQAEPASEAKLVSCARGAIFDVVLDLRPESSSFLKWRGVMLSGDNGRMLYLPPGCAHGYQTLEPDAEMEYMTSAFYTPSAVRGVRHDDPAFGIQWPLAVTAMSEQDQNWPLFYDMAQEGSALNLLTQ
jgi:dTDP-4-dehydrorhamnose 3,5-epimerase